MTDTENNPWVEEPAAGTGIRDQLIAAAGEHFSKYGYGKTTLADLAKAIGFSKSYFYRFFKSKQEIGEAICSRSLERIIEEVESEIKNASSSTEKLRRMLRTVPVMGLKLFFQNRKLYDIAAVSFMEQWSSRTLYSEKLAALIRTILLEGRELGEFERKTALDETIRAIMLAMQPFMDPRVLEFNVDQVPDGANEVIGLILRSLAP